MVVWVVLVQWLQLHTSAATPLSHVSALVILTANGRKAVAEARFQDFLRWCRTHAKRAHALAGRDRLSEEEQLSVTVLGYGALCGARCCTAPLWCTSRTRSVRPARLPRRTLEAAVRRC